MVLEKLYYDGETVSPAGGGGILLQEIAAKLEQVQENIARAAAKAGRNPEEIKLVAVSKTVDIPQVQLAIAAGLTDFGENRVQELTLKYEILGQAVNWHLIGHLQTNKVKYIIDKVILLHSLDRLSLAQELQKRAAQAGKEVNVLVQVNIAEEESKFGLPSAKTPGFIAEVAETCPLVKIKGLMTMAPYSAEPEETRPVFSGLRQLQERLKDRIPGVEMRHLSMGMSNDYMVAIEEGADIIRLGTVIFGPR